MYIVVANCPDSPSKLLSHTHTHTHTHTCTQNLEFEGVMRFYFQSPGSDAEKVATKCIRVSNTATTERVIEALVQKFRPDMRMLTSHSSYALYEVHPDQGEREREREREGFVYQILSVKIPLHQTVTL